MRSFIFATSLWLFAFATSHAANSDVLAKLEKTSRREYETKAQVFPVSTEMEIGKAWPILRKAPEGAYVSIGSERSFRGVSMTKHASALVVIDVAPEILCFVEINRQLLKAKTRLEYRNLRSQADYTEWERRFGDSLSRGDFEWWEKNVRSYANSPFPLAEMLNQEGIDKEYERALAFRKQMQEVHDGLARISLDVPSVNDLMSRVPFSELEGLTKKAGLKGNISENEVSWWRSWTRPESGKIFWQADFGYNLNMASVVDFETGNYLFDDELYDRLHKLATEEKIYAVQLDLTDNAAVQGVAEVLREARMPISVLDLDNVYPDFYIGGTAYLKAVRSLLRAGQDDSVLLLSLVSKKINDVYFQSYIGFRFSFVEKWSTDFELVPYLLALPAELLVLLNGKLYGSEHLPPYFETWKRYPPRVKS